MNGKTFSFEFFPPQTDEGAHKLRATRKQLAQLRPAFFSVTYGAGGSTQERTVGTVLEIKSDGQEVAPHISCIGTSKTKVRELIDRYRGAGIHRLVALRGDLPSGMVEAGEFRYASDLVAYVREVYGAAIHIEVAAYPEYHPQARSAEEDIRNFKRKVDAGASGAITQYFYNTDAYFAFVDECQAFGIAIPIIPGVMPITRFSQLARFSDACGAEIPRWIRRKLEGYGDDLGSIRSFGLDVVTDLCDRLLNGGAPGLHFYTLNQAGAVSTIWQRLGLS
ncbi:MAG: methylenetetrahydrofolate reductase [NAD(P)H] [Betaproteobacteria bacterium]|nr:methylenetetrahydrofolate reductase [NAD(P)H] [Betaproteobacteria bacterium]